MAFKSFHRHLRSYPHRFILLHTFNILIFNPISNYSSETHIRQEKGNNEKIKTKKSCEKSFYPNQRSIQKNDHKNTRFSNKIDFHF